MKSLDTNALLRLIVQDDGKQTAEVKRLLNDANQPFYINIIVLCEISWVLKKTYGLSRHVIMEIMRRLTQNDDFLVEDEGIVHAALEIADSCKADLADILIGLRNRKAGCTTTLTFDKQASTLDEFTLLA